MGGLSFAEKEASGINYGMGGLTGLGFFLPSMSASVLGTNIFETRYPLSGTGNVLGGPVLGVWQTESKNELRISLMPPISAKNPLGLAASFVF